MTLEDIWTRTKKEWEAGGSHSRGRDRDRDEEIHCIKDKGYVAQLGGAEDGSSYLPRTLGWAFLDFHGHHFHS